MKKRILRDSSIMWLMVFCSSFIFLWKAAFISPIWLDDVCDVIAILSMLLGVVLRMTGRAHKSMKSQDGGSLVTSGIYELSRNPMYLGTFHIGAGLVLLAWPIWALPLFLAGFYYRFNRHICHEEAILLEAYNKDYKRYCSRTPRLWPRLSKLKQVQIYKLISLDEALSTQESRALIYIPLAACLVEMLQERMIYGAVDVFKTIGFFGIAGFWFSTMVILMYQRPKKRS